MSELRKQDCLDPRLGNLIALYELSLLDEPGRQAFEEHLFDCAACRGAVESFLPVARVLSEHRDGLKDAYRLEALVTVNVPQQAAGAKQASVWARCRSTVAEIGDWLIGPRVLAPAFASALAIVLIVLVLMPRNGNRYQTLLVFEPLPYNEMVLMGEPSNRAEELFKQGMASYSGANYEDAAAKLSGAVALDSSNFSYLIYLGISQFMLRQPQEAVTILLRADRLTRYTAKEELQWYLFQSYLLDGSLSQADSIHQVIVSKQGRFAAKSDSLWKLIQK